MYYLLGKSLKHTLSPYIFSQMGLKYEAMELENEQEVLKFLSDRNFAALNVTIPYKEVVIQGLDYIDDAARNIGAVNTIVNKNGKLYGYNTDVFGMEYALKHYKISIKDKKVLILGSGGTAKSAQYVCQKMGAKSISFVSRTGKINYENCYEERQDIIINTTPVGMYPNNFQSPVDLTKFSQLSGVFDAVYNPLKTSLIIQAEGLNIPCGNGLIMLVAQAVGARNLFVEDNKQHDIKQIYQNLWRAHSNIVLVGMPGCGKSTIGSALAKILNKCFVDTDEEIERLLGTTVADVFLSRGEEYFRSIESEVICSALKKNNCVIATGGGAVLSKENREKIKSAFVAWIKRDIDLLEKEGRPLSKDVNSLEQLYKKREPLYKELADIIVCNGENYLSAASKIRSGYENFGN